MKKITFAAFTLTSLFACAACSDSDESDHGSGASSLAVTIAGDDEALTGFAFPPASPNELAFVDGWDLRFDRILVTVDSITLSDGPDTNPTDQSQTGAVVARANGPWAVDLSKPGAADPQIRSQIRPLHGDHGGDENPNAQELLHIEHLDGDKDFDPSVRYAFGFDIVAASEGAKKMNLDAAAAADYADMVAKGIAVLYVGTATFKGTDCKSSNAEYDFTSLPKSVKFRLGFKTPTKYINCQNTDLRGKAFGGEEAQRGVQIDAQAGTVAQITLHVDHPFWNTVDHDAAELFFDQMAAAASADGTLVLDDLAAVDFTSFKDKAGEPLPWRSCNAAKPVKEGTRSFDSGNVTVDPSAAEGAALRHYADYVRYQQSTQGHLNADGLCAIKRNFPAPD